MGTIVLSNVVLKADTFDPLNTQIIGLSLNWLNSIPTIS